VEPGRRLGRASGALVAYRPNLPPRRIATLDKPLQNGDIVEILINKQSSPSYDWLTIARTSSAKNRIRQWFKKERRDEALELGRASLEREARRQGFDAAELLRPEWLDEVRKRLGLQSTEDLLASLGFGGVGTSQVIGRLREIQRQQAPPARREPAIGAPKSPSTRQRTREDAVRVKGMDKLLVRFSRCCNPVPGEPIIGYVTRGRGVSIHRPDCPNLQANRASGDGRLVEVTWDAVDAAYYPVEVEIYGLDRPGLLSDVTQIVAESRTNILYALVRGRARRQNLAVIDLILEVKDLREIDHLRKKILKVPDVFSVERVARVH